MSSHDVEFMTSPPISQVSAFPSAREAGPDGSGPPVRGDVVSVALVQGIAWVAYATSTYFSMLPKLSAAERAPHFAANTLRTLIGVAVTAGLWAIYRKLPELRKAPKRVATVVAAASVLGGIVWLAAYVWVVLPLVQPDQVPPLDWPAFPRSSLDCAFVLLAWSAAYFALRFWREARSQERRASAATRRAYELEVHLLRQQLNSHFLFNSLTSIKSAIPHHESPARAMLDEFSDFLRMALKTSSLSMVPLAHELELARRYLAIEKLRFEEQLSFEVRCGPRLEGFRVPGLLVQPLVENAVRHGGPTPVHVDVSAAEQDGTLVIRVTNTGSLQRSPDARGVTRDGFGLQYVQERLARLGAGTSALRVFEDGGRVHAVLELRGRELTA